MGLCLTTMLSVEEFAALLIVGGFVNLRNNKQSGGYNVMTSDTDTWTPFLKDHKLFGCENAFDNVAEATKSKTSHGRSNNKQFCYLGQ